MYLPIVANGKQLRTAHEQRYYLLFVSGNCMMAIGLTLALCSIVMTYVYPEKFSLTIQILGHISTLLFVTSVKFGYIMRCVALRGLGRVQL